MDETPPTQSGSPSAARGVELDISFLDGRSERVIVRRLPIRQMSVYLDCFQDEAASVELFCDQEKGWADKLTADSYTAIADKGQELNLPIFGNWYRRLTARSEAMNPGLLKKALDAALAKIQEPQSEGDRLA
jgi:hypothetical protein